VITALLEFGVDPKARDNFNKMAIDYAKENGALQNTDELRKLEDLSR
jgi:adenylate kinase